MVPHDGKTFFKLSENRLMGKRALRILFFSVYLIISTLEQMPWTDVFFMGIQAPHSLAVSPNYFWKLEKNAENLVHFWSCTVMLFLCNKDSDMVNA